MDRIIYFATRHLVAVGALLLMACGTVQAQATIVVGSHDLSRAAGWNEGSLVLNVQNPAGVQKFIRVKFSGERKGALASLVILTSDWSIDVSKYVQPLHRPFASRIVVALGPWNKAGKIHGLALSLPYLAKPQNDSANNECTSLELTIFDGQLVTNAIVAAPEDRCTQ